MDRRTRAACARTEAICTRISLWISLFYAAYLANHVILAVLR